MLVLGDQLDRGGAAFDGFDRGRTQLRLEYFYRTLRKTFGVLMDGGQPAGGRWNYDDQNRGAFPKAGPGVLPAPARFVPDAVTRGGCTNGISRSMSTRSNGWSCPIRWA